MSTIQVIISFLTGQSFPLDIHPSDSVRELKEQIGAITGYAPEDQRFVYKGKCMIDERSISDYDVRADTKLHLILRLRNRSTDTQVSS